MASIDAPLLVSAIGLAMFALGAALAWLSASAVKKLAGLVLAGLGAMLALAALGAPAAAIAIALALTAAHVIVGAALLVRLQEAYASVDQPRLDAADAADDTEPPP